jgi:YVTN family beta-propeller protein
VPPLKKLWPVALAATIASHANADFVNFETAPVRPLAISPDNSTLAVCNTADQRVELFDLTGSILQPAGSIVVGIDPVSVAYRSNSEIWVVNHLSDSVSIVDLNNRVVTATLQTDDEPADVVFAGNPQRAYISCSQADTVLIFDPGNIFTPPVTIAIEGEDPRALCVSPEGDRVYVAIFESGNNSTILAGGSGNDVISFPPNAVSDPLSPYGGINPPPNNGSSFLPQQKAGNPLPPPVGLIVRKDHEGIWRDDNNADWSQMVGGPLASLSGRVDGWDLIDNDLAVIDTGTGAVTYATGLMNLCMAAGVNPASGEIFVVGTDATNEVRFEPILNGIFLRVMYGRVNPVTLESNTGDLNTHLDYTSHTTTNAQRKRSIGDPRGITWNADGSLAYVTGMGSNNVIVINPAGQRPASNSVIEVGEGPTGIVADNSRAQLYVLNRFENTISIISMESHNETARVAFFDPTPESIRAGRRHLYDTHRTSGLGHVSCASCHVDARTDRLAWDLGDPGGNMIAIDEARHNLGAGFPGLGTNFTDFHPMKGPMTTQTMQDIIGKEPHHWRGDRDGIEAFNDAFEALLGDDTRLNNEEMQEFEDYLATITIPPNPFRNLDNSLPTDLPLPGHVTGGRFGQAGRPMPNGNALRALEETYRPFDRGIDRGNFACVTCHTLPTGLGSDTALDFINFQPIPAGPNGEAHHALVSVDGSSQRAFKIPQTRTSYDKMGFDMTSRRSRAGFGFLHDGSIDGLSRFLSASAFEPDDNQQVADMVALMMAFSGSEFPGSGDAFEPPGIDSKDAHAAVGQQLTLTSQILTARLETFLSLADAGKIELVAHSAISEVPRGWMYLGNNRFSTDSGVVSESTVELLLQATPATPVTFTCVPKTCSERIGVDRDGDGIRNFDEVRDFSPEISGFQNPFLADSTDSTGNNGSTAPDGIPDGQNDFDGDGIPNSEELAAGSNPAGNLAVEVPLHADFINRMPLTLAWQGAPLGVYQVQFTDDLSGWHDSPNGHFIAEVNGEPLQWQAPSPGTRRFYRIMRLR